MGKRLDFSSRTVISPGPDLDIDELGVPKDVILTQSFPEPVNSLNKDRLEQMVKNGPYEIFGANAVILEDGKVINLKNVSAGTLFHVVTWIRQGSSFVCGNESGKTSDEW